MRIAAARALCRVGSVDRSLLIRQLDHDSPWMRLAAANAIDYLGWNARPAVAVMRRMVAGPSRENMSIRWALGHTLRVLDAAGDDRDFGR